MASNQTVQQQAAAATPPQLSMPGTTGAQLQSNSTSAIAKALVAIWNFFQSIVQAFNMLQGCGYIVSIVTNSNGIAVLYSNGWMVASFSSGTAAATSSASDIFGGSSGTSYYAAITFTFPVAFVADPSVIATGNTSVSGPCNLASITTSAAVMNVVSYTGNMGSVGCDFVAMGYWK